MKIGGNIFTDLANVVGGVAGGKKHEEEDQRKEELAANADARAQAQLELMQRQGESENQFRNTQTRLATEKAMGEQQSLPALQARLIDLYSRTGVKVTPQLKQQIGSMNYEALNGELNRAEREMEVRASKQLQQSNHLQILREQQMGANAEYQFAQRQWQQALDALGGGKFGPSVDKLAGTQDHTSPQWQQAAYSFLKGTADGQQLYNNYLRAGMNSYKASGMLMAAGGGATVPTMEQRTIGKTLPFEILSPQDQQARLQSLAGDLSSGKPVDLGAAVRSGTPIPGMQPAAPAAPSGPAVPFKGFGDPASVGMFSQPGATAPATDPRQIAAQISGDPSFMSQPAVAAPASAPVPNIPSMQMAPLFNAGPPSAPAPNVPSMQMAPLFHPAPPTTPLPQQPVQTPIGSPADTMFRPNMPLFSPTPPPVMPGPSAPPAPTPTRPNLFNGASTGIESLPSNLQPPANPIAAATASTPQQLNKLRAAITAPEAEQTARALLDQGMDYNLVTGSIPDAFKPLVSAKLPKRISPALFNQQP